MTVTVHVVQSICTWQIQIRIPDIDPSGFSEWIIASWDVEVQVERIVCNAS